MKVKSILCLALCLALAAAGGAAAQAPVPTPIPAADRPQIEAPEKVELVVPRVKLIQIKANCKLKFASADKDLEVVYATDDAVIVQALKPGQTYRLFVVGGKGDSVEIKTVEVVTAGDAPPAPVPPVPVPPAPPGPKPSALALDLSSLYSSEPDPGKLAKSLALARVYTAADDVIAKATAGEVVAALKLRSANEKLSPDDLGTLRDRIGRELTAILGRNAASPVTDAQRKALSDLFATISTTLRVVRSIG